MHNTASTCELPAKKKKKALVYEAIKYFINWSNQCIFALEYQIRPDTTVNHIFLNTVECNATLIAKHAKRVVKIGKLNFTL